MHPDRMTWLKQESLFNAAGHVAETVRFFEMPRARRLRTRAHWDEYDECLANATWTDMSPVLGCPDYSIGCPECLSQRQATAVTGEDMWCPWKTNPYTEEKCFWGEEGVRYGLCEDCFDAIEFGCGLGLHECSSCIRHNHRNEEIVQYCDACRLCTGNHDAQEDPHCIAVCPFNECICG